ncbi:MAG TPA: hypothetical protein DCL39_05625 [Alteromonas macleodii]|nr:hypothetical protein [Alteromonas macleodii]|tara:strand:+ start:1381 stop:3771 length:2391 start_codon:yes stop_codon:yes gene_type:complete
MYSNNKKSSNFPDPLAPSEEKQGKKYGLSYAKAIYNQWGKMDQQNSAYGNRRRTFEKNRRYANGTQDTAIYRSLLTSLDPNNGDGSMLNLDFTPVPILPKFVRIVVNKILSLNPYPNLEAIDPLSSSEKDLEKKKMEFSVKAKESLQGIKKGLGIEINGDPDQVPDTLEEAEIFMDANVKVSSEIAAQIATNLTLEWNDFNDSILRRCVNDLAVLGMAVVKRDNDPQYGLKTSYVDPGNFIHSFTEDPNFGDLVYAGQVKHIPIQELKRIAGDQFTEEQYKTIAQKAQKKYGYDAGKLSQSSYDRANNVSRFGYDEYMIEVLDFEFMGVDCEYYESKESRYGNVGFYAKGENYKAPINSVFNREVSKLETSSVYGGCYILGTDFLFSYGKKNNMPRNIHDISRTNLSYSVCATNLLDMMPKSMVDSCIGFADQLQLTHLKIQQAVAKAKPDGIIIDIEGLENVQLGNGGELQPLDLHDIYEQTGVFYYRSKNPEGGFQNPPIREIGNSIRNINELIGLYNHYLRMIRDATGINEVMDASTPKSDSLVGVRQQALAAANNAIYDITNSSMVLYKKVCSDIVKCVQVIHPEAVLYKIYENAIGKENMKVLSSFRNLAMYNFGVKVVKDMEEAERQYLEQNIQVALGQKEIDLEDAIAVRQLKDLGQAERLLIVRRKKRMAQNQQMAMQNSQQQSQVQQQSAQAASQARQQEMQMEAQIKAQEMQLKAQLEAQLEQVKHGFRREIEMIKAQATLGFKEDDKNFKEKLEVLKEDRKDERVVKQADEQSRLIDQRQNKTEE